MPKRNRVKKILRVLVIFIFALCVFKPVCGSEAPTMLQAYPDFAEGILKFARLAELPDGLLIKTDNFEIRGTFAEKMLKKMPPDMRRELEKNLLLLLDQEALEAFIKQDANSLGIKVDLMDEKSIETYAERITKDISVTDREAKSFYDQNQQMLGGMPFEQVKDSIKSMLMQQKKQSALQERLEALAQKSNMQISSSWVKKQVDKASDNPLDRARKNGKPTMVQFSSPGCPPCEMMKPILLKLKKKYSNKINWIKITAAQDQILARRFGIRAVPVQVFFDQKGKKVYQHVGFMSEEDILAQLKKMGAL